MSHLSLSKPLSIVVLLIPTSTSLADSGGPHEGIGVREPAFGAAGAQFFDLGGMTEQRVPRHTLKIRDSLASGQSLGCTPGFQPDSSARIEPVERGNALTRGRERPGLSPVSNDEPAVQSG